MVSEPAGLDKLRFFNFALSSLVLSNASQESDLDTPVPLPKRRAKASGKASAVPKPPPTTDVGTLGSQLETLMASLASASEENVKLKRAATLAKAREAKAAKLAAKQAEKDLL